MLKAAVTMSENSRWICIAGLFESVTSTVKRYAPGVVGAPEIVPFVEFSFRPGGSCPPATFQVKGCAPPLTAIFDLVNDPTVVEGSDVVVIVSRDCAHELPTAPTTHASNIEGATFRNHLPIIVMAL